MGDAALFWHYKKVGNWLYEIFYQKRIIGRNRQALPADRT